MEFASPSSEEPVTQIEADVPIEPLALQADATTLDLDLHVYERPLAVTPFGTPEDHSSLVTFIPGVFLRICPVILIFRCHCTADVFLLVVQPHVLDFKVR